MSVLCVWCVASSLVLLSCLSHVLHLRVDIDVHVGVTLFCSFSNEKGAVRNTYFS